MFHARSELESKQRSTANAANPATPATPKMRRGTEKILENANPHYISFRIQTVFRMLH